MFLFTRAKYRNAAVKMLLVAQSSNIAPKFSVSGTSESSSGQCPQNAFVAIFPDLACVSRYEWEELYTLVACGTCM